MSKTRARQLAAEINKMLGTTAVTMGSDEKHHVEYLSSGVLPIDLLFQGGIPRGRFVLVKGPFSTLKTYIALNTIAATQRQGGLCALIDTEHAFDPEWATDLGVDVDSLILQHPETGEAGVEAARLLTLNGVDLIVFDSIAAALPKQERGRRMDKDDVPPGAQGRLMSAACRQLTAANTGRTAFIWINQIREAIGVTFGPTERGPGGRAMGFYASMILDVRKSANITRDKQTFTGDKYVTSKEQIGQTFRATLEKSKLNRPFREIHFDFRLEAPVGFDVVKFLFSQGVELGLISKRGNTWQYGECKAVGKDKFLVALTKSLATQTKLEAAIRRVHLPSSDLPGSKTHPSKRVVESNAKPSKSAAVASTRTAEPAESSGMVRRRKTSSKSSTPARRTH